MKQIISKLMIATCILTGSAGLANVATAGTPGPVDTKTTNIVFLAGDGVSTTITPVTGLVAGNVVAGQLLANITSTTNDKSLQYFLIRFTPGSGEKPTTGPAGGPQLTLSGTGDKTNKLEVVIEAADGLRTINSPPDWFQWGGGAHFGIKDTETATIRAVGGIVKTDTYIVSVDTAIFII